MNSILLVDWPNRDVPDSLARAGVSVVAQEGPATYAAYEPSGAAITRRVVGEPPNVDAIYAYRPLDELPGIVEFARQLGAKTLWWETGSAVPDAASEARAREIVEAAGLAFHVGRPTSGK